MKLCFWELNLAAVDVDGEGQRWGDQLGSREDVVKTCTPGGGPQEEDGCMKVGNISETKLVEIWRPVE